MIYKIASLKYSSYWLAFHALLGIACTITPWALIVWFYIALFYHLPALFSSKTKHFVLNGLIIYLSSFEIIARMSGTSPYIPYELGKYILFIFLVYGIFAIHNKGRLGIVMVVLLIPGIILGIVESGVQVLVFNVLGPVNIALAILYFYSQRISFQYFVLFLRLLIYPLISVLFYTLIKSPDLNEIEFSLNANFDTTGGFGTNQISTVFGAAMFLLFVFVWNKWRFSQFRWLDIALLMLFSFRGLLSFSRGGMIGGAFAIIVIVLIQSRKLKIHKQLTSSTKKLFFYTPLIIAILVATFYVANSITGGLLSLRYAGETSGTLTGARKKSMTTFTSNRNDIFTEDLAVFADHVVFGVGVGQSMSHRETTSGHLPHIEMSRLLSEHGIFGLIFFGLLLWHGWQVFMRRKKPYHNVLLAFFVLALYTTFHAATRTYFTPLFIGLSVMSIAGNQKVIFVKRKQKNNPKPGSKVKLIKSKVKVKKTIRERTTLPRQ